MDATNESLSMIMFAFIVTALGFYSITITQLFDDTNDNLRRILDLIFISSTVISLCVGASAELQVCMRIIAS